MSLRFLRLFFTAGVVVIAGIATAPAQQIPALPPAVTPAAAPIPEPLVGPIKMPDADIDTVFGALENLTGKIIFRPQALPTATYNIRIDANTPVSRAVSYILTALQLNNIAIVPLDEYTLKAVPTAQARQEAPELIEGSTLGLLPSGRIATKIFVLNFLRTNELMAQMGNMMTANLGGAQNAIQLPNANAVLITETITNLQRIENFIRSVDRPATGGLTPKFYPLKNGARASDLVQRINTMIAPVRAQIGTATTITADDRSNQIILISHPANYTIFDQLIENLDVKADPNTNNAVIYLKHAVAQEVATLLNDLVTGQNTAAQRASANSVRQGQGVAGVNSPAVPGSPGNNVIFQGAVPTGPAGAPGANIPVAPPTLNLTPALNPNSATNALEAPSNQFSSLITVRSDPRSNAIVVAGTATDIAMIRALVDKLDVLLAQVRIEVVIAEVTLGDTDKSGLSALNLTVATDTPNGPGGDNGRGTHITNFAGAVAGWGLSSGIVNPLSFEAAMADAGSRNIVKVLQNPTIVTSHNKRGVVTVGSSVPYSTTTTTNGVSNQSVNFMDINLTLNVLPLIGDDGSIQLEIDQIINDQTGAITVAGSDVPIVGKRQATSFVNVYNDEMIVLGGLQRNSNSNGRTKLGFFAEIPIISHIFGARTKTVQRTELLLFIRPHILPPVEGTSDAMKAIETLSNKEQIKQYLADPSKAPKESIFERFK